MGSHDSGLTRAAAAFKRSGAPVALPRLWLFTDPARLADPSPLLARLPRGSAVVYRHFGAADRLAMAHRLQARCRALRLAFLIGADWRLAAAVGANGVHLPARAVAAATVVRRRRPDWLITASAHGARDLRLTEHLDAIILSPLLPTRSAAARPVLGWRRAGWLAAHCPLPVIALGGLSPSDAPRLAQAGFAGMAGIDLFLGP